MKVISYCLVVLCFSQIKSSHGAKILGFFATISRSHFIVEEPIMRELARRGHEVTVVSVFKQTGEPLENYRYIEIPEIIDDPAVVESRTAMTTGDGMSFLERYNFMAKVFRQSLDIMKHEKFLPLKNETFDLFVLGWMMNDYALGLSGHFKCPSVVISPNANMYSLRKYSGNPNSASTIPSILVNYVTPMTFFERLQNVGIYLLEFVLMEGVTHLFMKPTYLEAFPSDTYPSYDEVFKNISLVLLAQHFSGRTPEPLLPGVIEVEGMHVKKEPSPLPEVLIKTLP